MIRTVFNKLNIPSHRLTKGVLLGNIQNNFNDAHRFVRSTSVNYQAVKQPEVETDSGGYGGGHSWDTPETVHEGPLYPGHMPTTFFQKALLSVGSAAVAINAPWRDDMIATLGETTGYFALQSMRNKMLQHPVGREILQTRPRINSRTVDLAVLRALPQNTFGKVYADWLDENHVSPDSRRDVMFVDDAELAYVMQRYREVHDLLHTLLGMPTNMLGEVVVKWFEAIQTGLPMCVTGAMFGPIRLRPNHMRHYLDTHLWWVLRNSRNAEFFMNVYYEREWATPLDELRTRMRIEEPPFTPRKKKTVTDRQPRNQTTSKSTNS